MAKTATPVARERAAQSAEEALEKMERIKKGEGDFKAAAAQPNEHGAPATSDAASPLSSRASPTTAKALPAPVASSWSSSSSDILLGRPPYHRLIVSQRDRFRARNAQLEQELRRQFDVVTQLSSDIKRLLRC